MTVTATIENAVRRASEPSQLRITDIRVATIRAQGIHPILRIDTNQGVHGLGEVRDGAQVTYLPAAELLWAEAAGNYVELHAARGRTLLMRATLASLEARLEGAGFLRIHRSRIVNLTTIMSVQNQSSGDAILHLSNDEKIIASRSYRPALNKAMTDMVRTG